VNPAILCQIQGAMGYAVSAGGESTVFRLFTCPAVVSSISISTELKDGLFKQVAGLKIVFSKSLLSLIGTPPSSKELITARSAAYRIVRVDDDEVSWTLTCIAPSA